MCLNIILCTLFYFRCTKCLAGDLVLIIFIYLVVRCFCILGFYANFFCKFLGPPSYSYLVTVKNVNHKYCTTKGFGVNKHNS